mgnify:CR=1 FL=1
MHIRQDFIIKCDLNVGIVTTIGLSFISWAWKKQIYIVISTFFSIIRYYFSIFYLWLARRLQLTRSHVLLAVHSPSGGVPNGTSEIHAQDDL